MARNKNFPVDATVAIGQEQKTPPQGITSTSTSISPAVAAAPPLLPVVAAAAAAPSAASTSTSTPAETTTTQTPVPTQAPAPTSVPSPTPVATTNVALTPSTPTTQSTSQSISITTSPPASPSSTSTISTLIPLSSTTSSNSSLPSSSPTSSAFTRLAIPVPLNPQSQSSNINPTHLTSYARGFGSMGFHGIKSEPYQHMQTYGSSHPYTQHAYSTLMQPPAIPGTLPPGPTPAPPPTSAAPTPILSGCRHTCTPACGFAYRDMRSDNRAKHEHNTRWHTGCNQYCNYQILNLAKTKPQHDTSERSRKKSRTSSGTVSVSTSISAPATIPITSTSTSTSTSESDARTTASEDHEMSIITSQMEPIVGKKRSAADVLLDDDDTISIGSGTASHSTYGLTHLHMTSASVSGSTSSSSASSVSPSISSPHPHPLERIIASTSSCTPLSASTFSSLPLYPPSTSTSTSTPISSSSSSDPTHDIFKLLHQQQHMLQTILDRQDRLEKTLTSMEIILEKHTQKLEQIQQQPQQQQRSHDEMMDVMDEITSKIQSIKAKSLLPHVCFVGEQGCGKSTLIQRMLHIPVHYQATLAIPTLCPVSYTIHHNPSIKSPIINQPYGYTLETINTYIQNHMKTLKTYDAHPLEIELECCDFSSMLVMDLPGFCSYNESNPTSEYYEVNSIVSPYIGNPEYAIVIVTNACKMSMSLSMSISHMQGPQRNPNPNPNPNSHDYSLNDVTMYVHRVYYLERKDWKNDVVRIITHVDQYINQKPAQETDIFITKILQNSFTTNDGLPTYYSLAPEPDTVSSSSSGSSSSHSYDPPSSSSLSPEHESIARWIMARLYKQQSNTSWREYVGIHNITKQIVEKAKQVWAKLQIQKQNVHQMHMVREKESAQQTCQRLMSHLHELRKIMPEMEPSIPVPVCHI